MLCVREPANEAFGATLPLAKLVAPNMRQPYLSLSAASLFTESTASKAGRTGTIGPGEVSVSEEMFDQVVKQ